MSLRSNANGEPARAQLLGPAPMSPGKFAFTASDQYIGVIKAFLDCGWKPLRLFTAPITGHMASNNRVIELAQSHGD
jgi:methionyl-tRNA formyltransferase